MQERIRQHEVLRSIHPSSINTLRLLTIRTGEEIQLLSAVLRIGAGESTMDNWNSGGVAVPTDLQNGATDPPGLSKREGRCVWSHPDTDVSFDGYSILLFQKSKKMVKNAHKEICQISSIGWDISISPQGPIIIEGNYRWDGPFHMSLEDNFRSRFL
jgi:hypothetical protein